MASMAEIYGDDMVVQRCPAWIDFPGEVQPGGREMIRDESHPCHGCRQEAAHKVPGRAWFPDDTEAGGNLPFNKAYAWPDVVTIYRMLCVNDQLFHAGYGPIAGLGVSNLFDDLGNSFSSEVVSGVVVSASGQTLTVKTPTNPLDCYIQRWVENPDFDGVDEEEPRFINKGIRTSVEPGDLVGFEQSPVAGKIVCRVTEVLSGSWGGPASTWSFKVDQQVGAADQPLRPLFTEARFGITREAVAPRNWIEPRPSYPLFVSRIEGARIDYETMLGSPVTPRVELRDTAGSSCRIAIPSAPNPSLGWAGSFHAIKKSAGGGSSDVTSAVAASLRIEHVGATGYRTTIDAGAHLLAEGDELVLLYEPEWRDSDGAGTKRASCQSICHHSKYHPKIGWACGLGGRRELDPEDDNNPANMPPDGIANYRGGSEAGCYQRGVCSDFTPSRPFSYQSDFAGFLQGIHNGYVAREDQSFPGAVSPSAFTTGRPLAPSGVPGLGPMAGRVARTPDGYHAIQRLVPTPTPQFVWATGSNGSRKIRWGAEIELTDGPRRWDLAAGEEPKPGIFLNRFGGGALDSFGEPWNETTDPTKGLRDAGGFLPSCSRSDSGQVLGPTEADRQTATFRRVVLPRVALGAGSTSAQRGDWMTATLGSDDSLTLAVHPLGDARDTGYGLNAKVFGTVAAASMDGGLVKIEVANQTRQCTVTSTGFEDHSSHYTGGHFVKLPDAYQPFDPNDDESTVEAANMYRGAIRGDTIRFAGAGGDDADEITAAGFYVSRALPCAGTEEPWGGARPAPPAGWIAAPKNYADWLAKRDVVWLWDRADGLLAGNLANLVGASISCFVAGIIAPVDDVEVFHAEYQSDWSAVDASDIESIDRWRGLVVLKPSFVQALDRTTSHCFRIDAKLMDRRRPVSAHHFREVQRRQGFLNTMRGVIGNGTDGRIYAVEDTENPFDGTWGINQRTILNTQTFGGLWTLNGTAFDPEALEGPLESHPCNPGYYVTGDALLSLRGQIPGQEVNSFGVQARVQTPGLSYRQLGRIVELRLASYVGIGLLGTIANWPSGTEVVTATCNIRVGGLYRRLETFEFEGDGASSFSLTTTVDSETTGSGTFKLGLYGYKVNPETGESFATLIGSGGTVSTTDGEWRTVNITDIVAQAVNFKATEYIALALIPMPTIIDIPVGSDAGEALAAFLPAVDFETYHPLYTGCSGSPSTPVINPDAWSRKGSYQGEYIEWGTFEVADPVYKVSWPSNFGRDIVTLNDSNGHNWPPKDP